MELQPKKYKQKELAEWFGINYNSFRMSRDKKLEELKDYADFEIEYNPTSKRITSINVKKVYHNVYYKSYKKDLIDFIDKQSNWECILDEGYGNVSILVNYYCKVRGIKYNGNNCHYLTKEISATTEDTKEKVVQEKRKRNKEEYKTWFYLYDIAKQYIKQSKKLDFYSKEDCSVDSYFPLKLKRNTEEMEKEKAKIYEKYFGTNPYYGRDEIEVYSIVDVDNEDDERTLSDLKEELKQTKSFLRLSDKEKREAYFRELMEKGLYPTAGYKMGSYIENKEDYGFSKMIEAKEGEFNFE